MEQLAESSTDNKDVGFAAGARASGDDGDVMVDLVQKQSKPSSPRLLQLDILRGLAILLVLFRHPAIYPGKATSLGLWQPIASWLLQFGWTGVDLFFVLSGFLIGGLLFQEIRKTGRLDARRFLIRRGFKIWPPYFVLVAWMYVALIRHDHMTPHRALTEIKWNLLHLQNYFWSPRPFTWSLSVEEHFYLALPIFLLVVLYFLRRPIKAMWAVPVVAVATIIFVTLFRTVHNWFRPFSFIDHAAYTHLRIDGLMFGVLLAYLHHFHADAMSRLAKYRNWLLVIGILLLSPMFYQADDDRFVWTIGFTMLYLGYGAILLALVHTKPGEGWLGKLMTIWPMRAIAWVGFFSYSIYLWQEDLSQDIVKYHMRSVLVRLPVHLRWPVIESVHIALAVAGGALMAKLIEIPSISLRDRFFPPRTQRIEQHPVSDPRDVARQEAPGFEVARAQGGEPALGEESPAAPAGATGPA